jgi:hypothetical protein
MAETWLLCTACRTNIPFGEKYFQCSVSTCNRARMRLVFCSVVCWDSHVADARHRDAWAEDKIAPTRAEWEREQGTSSDAARPAPRPAAPPPRPAMQTQPSPAIVRPPATPAASAASATPASPAASATPEPARRLVGIPTPSSLPSAAAAPASGTGAVHLNDIDDRDMLIVISKLKKYIKDRSGMNCSDAVADVLSDHIRVLCDDSIRAAGRDERKTVLDRDVPRPRLR